MPFEFPGHADTNPGPYYLFLSSETSSLEDWDDERIPLPQGSSPNLGIWGLGVNIDIAGIYYVFNTETQPSSWGEAVAVWNTPDVNEAGTGDYSVVVTVTDVDSNPIQGARVTILDSGAVVRSGNTDTDGTVQFSIDADSYTINVSVYGFTDSIGTALTVDGNESVTISMTPAVAVSTGMAVSYSSLLNRVGHYLFGIRGGFSTDQTNDILDCINDGLKRVYAAHEWSFFRPVADVVTTAPYATGTITIASGVVTLTGGTFPSWAASGILRVDSKYYSVASRGSNTQITLDTSVTIATASNYQLALPEIAMDSAFEAVANDSDLTYYPSPTCWHPPVKWRHDSLIRKLEQTNPEFDRPQVYSVRTSRFDATVGSRKVLVLYPAPDQVYTLRVPMVLRPVPIDAVNQYPIGGELLSQVILESCLALAERNFEERKHVHEDLYLESIALAIKNDQERSSPTSLGRDAPSGENGKFGVLDYDYRLREQRISSLTLNGTVL